MFLDNYEIQYFIGMAENFISKRKYFVRQVANKNRDIIWDSVGFLPRQLIIKNMITEIERVTKSCGSVKNNR